MKTQDRAFHKNWQKNIQKNNISPINKVNIYKLILKIVLLLLIIFTYPAYGTSISVSVNCLNATSYNFDEYSYDPDFKIKFNSYAINPDYIVKVLATKVGADIVLEDNSISDISVCKSNKGKTIAISRYVYDPDFTIEISSYESDFDFTIYNDSQLTIEEAIAILIVPSLPILNYNN
mgnify:CR=1 FL=1